MTAENLGVADQNGVTGYHLAARSGAIGLIPAQHLTLENLTTPDSKQSTPLHTAVFNGHLPKIYALVPKLCELTERP